MRDLLARAPPSIPSVDAQEAHRFLQEGGAVLVDVREGYELAQARVPGALHIPIMEVPARAEEIPRDRTVILICHSGSRSFHAGRALAALGYPDVLNLENGILGWMQAGLPIERGA